MGLTNNVPQVESEGRKLTIVNGQFALRVDENTEGAIPRALTKGDNEGKEVFELLYPTLTGFIQSGEIRELPFGLSCEVTIADEGELYTVQFSSDSKHFTALATRLPNIDRSIPVALSLVPHKTKTTKTGKPVVMLLVIQDNKRVDDYYVKWSKDEAGKNVATHLHGLPEVKKTRSGWDFTDQMDFYLDAFESYFKGGGVKEPDVEDLEDHEYVGTAPDEDGPALEPDLEPDDDDSLPF